MRTEFDFDEIGKRTPYRTPDGFFDEARRRVMAEVGVKPRRKNASRLRLVVITALATAAIVAGLFFIPSFLGGMVSTPVTADVTSHSDTWIHNLSDDQLDELLTLADNDLFLD
ncbi:MAG: hypothetical protein LBN29_04930 [Mediterranea sp.]|jgi:hypothetical protein|nr:hypothetical protein [Mediterranea sp.]